MPKQLHINMIIDLPDDHWRESEVKSAVKPLYDQFSQALTAAGITFHDGVHVKTPRPPKPPAATAAAPAVSESELIGGLAPPVAA